MALPILHLLPEFSLRFSETQDANVEVSPSLPTSKPFCQFYLPNPSLPSVSVAIAALQACITSHSDYFKQLLSRLPASTLHTALQISENLCLPTPAVNFAMVPYCPQDKVRVPLPHASTHLAFSFPCFLQTPSFQCSDLHPINLGFSKPKQLFD